MAMRPRRNRERGVTIVFVAITLVVLIGFVALVMDLGKLFKTRSELQNASDSAAHAGATALDGTSAGIARARDRAKEYAALHFANGSTVEIADEDILFGHWDDIAHTFTSFGTEPANPAAVNAVRVIDRREGGDSVMLDLATLLGRPSSTVHTDAIAVGGGPRNECAFPIVVADCSLSQPLADGSCAHCLRYQDNNTDTAGWTSFDAGSVSGPTIAGLIRSACFDAAGNVAVDPVTHECMGTCTNIEAGDDVKVQNGNLLNQGANGFCSVIQTVLRRGIANGTPAPFVVRAPVLASTPGSSCDASQFSSFHTIAGFAAFEIYGAKCSNNDPGVFVSPAPCAPPPSGKFIIGALRCDLESLEGVAGGGYFGIQAKHIRIVE